MIEGSPSGKGEPNRRSITGPVDKRLGPVPNVRVYISLSVGRCGCVVVYVYIYSVRLLAHFQ